MDFVWFIVIMSAWIVFDAITTVRDPSDDIILWNSIEEYISNEFNFYNDVFDRDFDEINTRLNAIEEKLNGLSNPQA